MATKVFIIDVDLGETIDNIISKDVAELTSDAKKELDAIIKVNKLSQQIITQRSLEREREDALSVDLYNRLLDSKSSGILIDDLLKIAEQYIKSASGLQAKIKAYLRKTGNEYALVRKKKENKTYLLLEPHNLHEPNTEDDSV